MTALDRSRERPRCQVASCGEPIWWNPRRNAWEHYFDPGDHEAAE